MLPAAPEAPSPAKHRLVFLALAAAALAGVLVLAWARPLDAWAQREVEAGFQRALASFAAARGLNAVLSAVQSASVNVGVGVGASVHPGAVLEPLDDLVEQLSTLLLAATVSFGLQRLLIELLATWPVNLALSLAGLAWLALAWTGRPLPRWLPRLALFLLCLRLAVPLMALGGEAIHRAVLAGDYQAAQAQLAQEPLPAAAPAPGSPPSLAERVRRWWADGADVARQVEQLKARADALVAQMVRLIAVFALQTVVWPLAFLLLGWFLLQKLLD